MLCTACANIFRGHLEFNELYGLKARVATAKKAHHLTANDFHAAVERKCRICVIAWRRFSENEAADLSGSHQGPRSTQYHFEKGLSKTPADIFTLCISNDHDGNVSYWAMYPARDADARTTRTLRNTSSDPCFELVCEWFAKCVEGHSLCKITARTEVGYPSRLIELGSADSDYELRIYTKLKGSPEAPYLTLSHRWGAADFLKLTQSTFERLHRGFSIAELPQTFRDAVVVARKLGVRYVWIDALCIIQDSKEDWQYEAAMMGMVYKNAICNISATGAWDSREGCFCDRDTTLVDPYLVKCEWDSVPDQYYQVVDYAIWEDSIVHGPVNQRAWVVQERLLAPRILHYAREEVFWECQELMACETFPRGIPEGFTRKASNLNRLIPRTLSDAASSKPHNKEHQPDRDLYDNWRIIVREYTRCKLTKSEDKLVALSGIAKQMQLHINDVYLAGMWKGCLSSQLLWHIEGDGVRPQSYRAPSWSWASVDGPAESRQEDPTGSSLITILDATTTPLSADHTGQVKNGHVRLRGRLYSAKIPDLRPWRKDLFKIDSQLLDSRFNWFPDVKAETSVGDNYFLPLYAYADQKYDIWISGLVLRSAGQTESTYVRWGYIDLMTEDMGRIVGVEEDDDEFFCSPSHYKYWRTITLV